MNLQEPMPGLFVAGTFSLGPRVAVPFRLKKTSTALMLACVAFSALALVGVLWHARTEATPPTPPLAQG